MLVLPVRVDDRQGLSAAFAARIVEWSCGEPELRIKDLQDACFDIRLSRHHFWAN